MTSMSRSKALQTLLVGILIDADHLSDTTPTITYSRGFGTFAIGRPSDQAVLLSEMATSRLQTFPLHASRSELRIFTRNGALLGFFFLSCLQLFLSGVFFPFICCTAQKSHEGMRWIYGGRLPFLFCSVVPQSYVL